MYLNNTKSIKLIALALVVLFCSPWLNAQTLQDDLRFSRHLSANDLDKDNILLLTRALAQYKPAALQRDTICYSLGKSYYSLNTDSALAYFAQVDSGSYQLYNAAQFVRVYLLCQQDSLALALKTLELVDETDDVESCLKKLEAEAIHILVDASDGTWQGYYDTIANSCAHTQYNTGLLQYNLEGIKHHKKKSAWVAGALSAIVPGLGRVYAGKPKQGLMVFLPFVVMGLQAYEGYRNGGLDDARFIAYASVTSIFYLGNVWGSALAPKLKEKEVYNEIHYQVMASLRVPIDQLLGKSR